MSFLFALMLAIVPSSAVIVRPVANMYSGPTEEADVVSQAIYGTNVALIEDRNGWAKVRTPDDYTGWMLVSSLRLLAPGDRLYASTGKIAQIDSLEANLYREPDVTRHQPLLTVPFETRVEVIAEPQAQDRRWIEVRLPDDRHAWVQRGDVVFDPGRLTVDQAIELSRRFLGLPYLWGGTSSFGYDCSGFTQMLCRRRGYNLPRDAGPQARWSGVVPIERKDLRPGDLLYFGKSDQKITHTGMYIGNGEFVNATTHERPVVQISRLDDPYWSALFVAARRLK